MVVVLVVRAVSGVGALMRDFFGVSVTVGFPRVLKLEEEADGLVAVVKGFGLRRANIKGWRIAV